MYMHACIHIFDAQVNLPGVPVFLSAIGIFDVDYTISVACRDSFIYSVRK